MSLLSQFCALDLGLWPLHLCIFILWNGFSQVMCLPGVGTLLGLPASLSVDGKTCSSQMEILWSLGKLREEATDSIM